MVADQLWRETCIVPLRQPLHHFGFQRLKNQDAHRNFCGRLKGQNRHNLRDTIPGNPLVQTSVPMASSTKSPITKAIFPVAGLGTRFLPATKAQPKEMLPVVDKPLIQYAVEEAYEAGVREMIFVTGRHKRPIEDHFDMTFELEVALENSGKQDLLEVVRSVKPDDMQCIYVRQAQALGLGHAVLCGQRLVGNEAFAVLLADDLMVGPTHLVAAS